MISWLNQLITDSSQPQQISFKSTLKRRIQENMQISFNRCLYGACHPALSNSLQKGFAYFVGPARAHMGPYGPIWVRKIPENT